MGRRRRNSRRSRNRARARSRAQASAKKRNAARKASGRKPSGANKAANRAAARARAQAAARKRIAQKRTIAQTKARNQQRMRAAAAERNRKFQAEKAAAAKRRQEAAAKRKADAAAKKKREAAAKRKAQETSRKAAVDRARKAAEARKKAEAAKKQTPAKTFNDAKTTIQNKNLIAASPGYTTEDKKNVINYQKKIQADPSYKMKSYEKDSIMRQYGRFPTAALGNVTNLGIGQEKTYFRVRDASEYGVKSPDTLGRDVSFGPVRDGDTYARNITNYGMKFGRTPEARGKAYEQSLNPKSFKGLSDGQTVGSGPVASGDAYARGLNTDNKNVENRLRQVRNLGSTLTGGLIPSVRKLTDKEIADRRTKVAAQRRANFMGRKTGGKGGGGVSRIQQQAAATQMQPEIAPTIGTLEEDLLISLKPDTQGDLTRIQNQAYNTQLTSSLAGMFGGQGSVGYVPQGDTALSPTLRAGRSRGRRRVRLFGGRGRRGGTGDQFSRAGERIAKLTNINI